MAVNVVLVEPRIPQNTGNIARTCVVTGSALHIVGLMGFSLSEKRIRRAGLDYWKDLELYQYDDLNAFFIARAKEECWFFSSKVEKSFDSVAYGADAFLVFGNEVQGLSPQLLAENADKCVRIPMAGGQRCLNLSNAACVGVYEALRQHGYAGLR